MKATDHDRLSPSLRHHEFTDGAELAGALATKVGAVLQAAITARGQARLAVSGGSTPKRFFEALALEEIDWTHVTVTLIDERLVPADNERSNHGLANRHLLKNKAAAARFIPLYAEAEDAEAAARIAATRIDGLGGPLDVAVLGMGTDGHTASFFPGGSTLAQATDIDCPKSVIAIEAPGAGEPRLTLTLPRIVEAGLIVLHIEGTEKKAVLARALQPGPDADMPVRSVLRDAAEPVEIYWAP
jgi:6-phosphogluconolactonase